MPSAKTDPTCSEKDKRQVIYDTGHAAPRKEFIRESLDWLDKYLAVKR